MYYAHFGLKQPPFKITPNTEFFYLGGNRGAVLDALIYAVKSGEGIIKVVGEVGSGKTMLCRMLQVALPESIESVYLANPSVAPEDILHAIAFELQLELPENPDRLKVMQVLQTHLLARHAAGRQVVIFVEEAQGMPISTLEEIRLLSNLETKYDKLLQIVLFGQPELDENLNETRIRQLRERITHSFYLEPFDTKEISEYLIFRLRAAGYFGPPLFTKSAVEKIASVAQGLVRRVNILADKSLLAAFADNVYQVTPQYVVAAIKDSEFGFAAKKSVRAINHYRMLLGLLLLSLITIAASYFIVRFAMHAPQPKPAIAAHPATTKKLASHDVANVVIATLETTSTALSEVPATSTIITAASATDDPKLTITAPLTTKSALILPVVTQPSITKQVLAIPGNTVTTAPISKSFVPNTAGTISTTSNNKPLAKLAHNSSPNNMSSQPETDVSSLRLEATKNWLSNNAEQTNTLQLFGVSNEAQLQIQLDLLTKLIRLEQVYVYRTTVNQQPYFNVVYGSFEEKSSAQQALKNLPNTLQKYHPHLRTIAGILRETKDIPQ